MSFGTIEPLWPTSTEMAPLEDKALSLVAESGRLAGMLHPVTRRSVIDLFRVLNSYYSNLIESHKTHPVEIQAAMTRNWSCDPAKRALQIESLLHVRVQRAIEDRLGREPRTDVSGWPFLSWIHASFYQDLPSELAVVEAPETQEKLPVEAGRLRCRDVRVGSHIAPPPDAVPVLLKRLARGFDPERLPGTRKIALSGALHHRLLWIHPFLDGNGRVARLLADAWFIRCGVEGYGLWTISRGLARNINEYRRMLVRADAPRQGDFDGRGALSSRMLAEFCDFFLETALDQVRYMTRMLALNRLEERIRRSFVMGLMGLTNLRDEAAHLLVEALLKGEFPRGEAARISGLAERTARSQLSALVKAGLLVSDSPKGPVRLGFPVEAAQWWLPNLIPERPIDFGPADDWWAPSTER